MESTNTMRLMIFFLVAFCFRLPTSYAVPLSRRIVDMTHTFDESTIHWPGIKKFQMNAVINGTEKLGFWLQSDEYSSSTHAGTHMDAPAHFVKGGITIEKISLSSLIAPAAVIDITTRAALNSDAEVTIEDLLNWESVTGQTLNGTILLLRSGWGQKWNDRMAFYGISENDPQKLHFPGLTRETAEWLVANRDIKGIGTEALSFDLGNDISFPAHKVLLGHGIFGLENIANMDQLPIYGAMLYVMPMKIGNASGAPIRIFATFPVFIFDKHVSSKEQTCNDGSIYLEEDTISDFD